MSEREFDHATREMFHLYEQGHYAAALEFTEQLSEQYPHKATRTVFWRVCLLCRVGRVDEALLLLTRALDEGFWWTAAQFEDADLEPLFELPEFDALVQTSSQRHLNAMKTTSPDRIVLAPDAPAAKPYPLLIGIHGRHGNMNSDLDVWDAFRRHGWLVLSPQSSLPLSMDTYCWDNRERAEQEIVAHFEAVCREYPVDKSRVIIGGFSQGAGLSVYLATGGRVPVCGFIPVACWWPDVESIDERARSAKDLRGYFITGDQDNTLERGREIQAVLKKNGIPFESELHPGLAHEFPKEIEQSLERALAFIL